MNGKPFASEIALTETALECPGFFQMLGHDEWRATVYREVTGLFGVPDVLVAFSERPLSRDDVRGGRHVELGVALAVGKPVVLVGKPEHVFHSHPGVVRVDCKTDMARALRALAERAREAA